MAGWLALAISNDFGCHCGSLGDGWETTSCIRTPNTKTTIGATHKQTVHITTRTKWLGGWLWLVQKFGCQSNSPGDGWEMAGWLPQDISKDCGCNCRSLQDGWELIRLLASTSPNDFGWNRRSPRNGWEMAGWRSNHFQGLWLSFWIVGEHLLY